MVAAIPLQQPAAGHVKVGWQKIHNVYQVGMLVTAGGTSSMSC